MLSISKKPYHYLLWRLKFFLRVLFFSTAVTMQLDTTSFPTLSPSKSAYLFAHNTPSVEESKTSFFD